MLYVKWISLNIWDQSYKTIVKLTTMLIIKFTLIRLNGEKLSELYVIVWSKVEGMFYDSKCQTFKRKHEHKMMMWRERKYRNGCVVTK